MKAIRVTYNEGKVELLEPTDIRGPVEGFLILAEPDPWSQLLQDPTPRPDLSAEADKALADLDAGRTTPLELTRR